MTFVGSFQTDPKDYAFHKFINEQKELDTDELRHLIKPVVHIIDQNFKGQEHKFCDKSQLCPLGKYRRPKHVIEAEQRGFSSGLEMAAADKKAKEEADQALKTQQMEQQQKEIDDLKQQLAAVLQALNTPK